MSSPTKETLRVTLAENLDETMRVVNLALRSKGLGKLKPILQRIGRGQRVPHWFEGLRADGILPNADGKTIGSIVEMLLLAVIEAHTFAGIDIPELRINPARGVDFPDLDLGIKSPSKNFCTSEPYFSAYERLLGSAHDVLVLITDYQVAKKVQPLRLQIIHWRYLRASQVADQNLCKIARKHREWLVAEDTGRAQRLFRFLAYINQSDWRAARLLKMINDMTDDALLCHHVETALKDFTATNKKRMKQGRVPLPDSEIDAFQRILKVHPRYVGVLDAAENWLVEVCKETARAPSESEWKSLLASPLDGAIGVSLALQWRYNFGRLFGLQVDECEGADSLGF